MSMRRLVYDLTDRGCLTLEFHTPPSKKKPIMIIKAAGFINSCRREGKLGMELLRILSASPESSGRCVTKPTARRQTERYGFVSGLQSLGL